MRLKPEIKQFIKETSNYLFPNAEVYLFGSRTDDNARGGDIDLLILSDQKIDHSLLRKFKVKFYQRFGWQKVDLINFTRDQQSIFKSLVEPGAKILS